METRKSKPNFAKLAVYLIVFLVFGALWRFVWASPIPQVIAMAALVLLCANLIALLLGLIKPKTHRGASLVTLFSSLTRYVAAIVILCWGLSIFGVDVNTIVASVGVVALVVGFGAESLVADLITGVFMLFEDQYNVGDIVEVNGFRGTVQDIGIRTTSIVDLGGNVKIINNSDMKNILNRSNRSSRAVANIAIPYETDLEALEAKLPGLLAEIYEAHKDIMKAEPRYMGVAELADSSVLLRFVAEVPESEIYAAGRVLNRDLWLGFRKLGVECPFPQVDVHSR